MIFPEYVTVKHENPERPDNGLWVWSTVRPNGFTTRSHQIFASYESAVLTAEDVARSQRMTFRHTEEPGPTAEVEAAWAQAQFIDSAQGPGYDRADFVRF